MKKVKWGLCIIGGLLCIPGQSYALLIGVSQIAPSSIAGNAAIILAPAFALDAMVTNTAQQGFDEAQNVLLLTALSVDGGTIAAGTRVNSHMIFFNQAIKKSGVSHTGVTWTFDGTILGVMSDTPGALEDASTLLLGAIGTTYPASGSFAFRGMEGCRWLFRCWHQFTHC